MKRFKEDLKEEFESILETFKEVGIRPLQLFQTYAKENGTGDYADYESEDPDDYEGWFRHRGKAPAMVAVIYKGVIFEDLASGDTFKVGFSYDDDYEDVGILEDKDYDNCVDGDIYPRLEKKLKACWDEISGGVEYIIASADEFWEDSWGKEANEEGHDEFFGVPIAWTTDLQVLNESRRTLKHAKLKESTEEDDDQYLDILQGLYNYMFYDKLFNERPTAYKWYIENLRELRNKASDICKEDSYTEEKLDKVIRYLQQRAK